MLIFYIAVFMRKAIIVILALIYSLLLTAQNVESLNNYGFVENKGQITGADKEQSKEILYSTDAGISRLFLGKNKIHYLFEVHNSTLSVAKEYKNLNDFFDKDTVEQYRIDIELLGSNPMPEVEAYDVAKDYLNFYNTGNNNGIIGVRHFNKVRYKDIYPGIDWVWYFVNGQVKYEFVVQPWADYKNIKLKVTGANSVELLKDGSISVKTPLGVLNENAPVSFINKSPTPSSFVVENETISFDVPDFKKNGLLVIDPVVLVWSTYYGGEKYDIINSTNVDKATNDVYIAGFTGSLNNIYFNGHQSRTVASSDAFLAKFDEKGTRIWATYYGATGTSDGATGVATNDSGHVYITGYTRSKDTIAFRGDQSAHGGGADDAFLAKFDKDGVRQWATYFGSTGEDIAYCISVTASNYVWIGGSTTSSGMGGFSYPYRGNGDGFCTLYNPGGRNVDFFYVGGGSFDEVVSMVSGENGDTFYAGNTKSSSNIYKGGGHQNSLGGRTDAFIGKTLIGWQSYYGGSEDDEAVGISVDADGYVYLAGETNSTNNISTNGAYQTSLNGNRDAFLAKFNSVGFRQWGTYFGGEGSEAAKHSCSNYNGDVFMTGFTNSKTGISFNTNSVFNSGISNIYLVKFNKSGARILGTYFGDTLPDFVQAVTCDTKGAIYIAGYTENTANIAFAGHQTVTGGNGDGFLAKFSDKDILPDGLSDFTFCGNLSLSHIVSKPSKLFISRWYDTDTSTNWFYEGDTLTIEYTKSDTLWVSLSSPFYTGPKKPLIITLLPTAKAVFQINDSVQCTSSNNFVFTNYTDTSKLKLSYRWGFGEGNTSSSFNASRQYLNAGKYVVSLTVTNTSNGCVSMQTKPIEVIQSPFQIITGNTTSKQGDTEVYSAIASSGSTYTWVITGGTQISGGNTATISVKWGNGILGDLVVTETDINGCQSRPAGRQVSLSPSSVYDDFNSVFSLSPNPASKNLNLTPKTEGSYFIIDLLGRELLSGDVKSLDSISIDISSLSAGSYLFIFKSGISMYKAKISIN